VVLVIVVMVVAAVVRKLFVIVAQEIVVQPGSKKPKPALPQLSSGLTPDMAARRALANGAMPTVPVLSSVSDGVLTKSNDVSSRLKDQPAVETNDVSTAVVKPSMVETKPSTDVLPQNSAVVAPALSHSAKV